MRHSNVCRYFLAMLMPLILAACTREPEFDTNFKASCASTSNGNSRYCTCALSVLKQHIKPQALGTLSTGDIERLAPEIIKTCNP